MINCACVLAKNGGELIVLIAVGRSWAVIGGIFMRVTIGNAQFCERLFGEEALIECN